MIVFSNLDPIEVNEEAGQAVIDIDPIASGISELTRLEISTIDGTAVSTDFNASDTEVDFNPISGLVVNVDPNDPDTLSFTVDIIDDRLTESEESFQFRAIGADDPTLNGTTSIIIQDNDDDGVEDPNLENPDLAVEELLPQISITDVEQPEGNSGTSSFEFIVSLSAASEETVTVDYATANGTGEAEPRLEGSILIDEADYLTTAGTLEFNPGETEKTVTVEVLTDTNSLAAEAPNETFLINLANSTNANVGDLVGTGTILDDDQTDLPADDLLENELSEENLPILNLADQTVAEGNLGEDITQQLRVNLTDVNGEPVVAPEDITFSYRTADIDTVIDSDSEFTGANAIADSDYRLIDNESTTIAQGQSSTSIPVTILGDNQAEANEQFSLVLSNLSSSLVQFENNADEFAAEITIQSDDGFDEDDFDEDDIPDSSADLDFNDLRDSTVFRFFDAAAGVHFYTASEPERNFVEANLDNYQLEDSNYASVNPDNDNSAAEIYRFFNPATGGHLYTSSETERDFIIDNLDTFIFEDVAFFAFESNVDDSIPVYRFFEPNLGVHFYTGNETERSFIEDNLDNYQFEGIAYYGLPLADEPNQSGLD